MSLRAVPTTDREPWESARLVGVPHTPKMTLIQVGKALGITREGVRYHEKKALAKLRAEWDRYEEHGWPIGYRDVDFGLEKA